VITLSTVDLYGKRYGSYSLLNVIQIVAVFIAFMSFFFIWIDHNSGEMVIKGVEMIDMAKSALGAYSYIPLFCFIFAVIEAAVMLLPNYFHIEYAFFSGKAPSLITVVIGVLWILLAVLFIVNYNSIKWNLPHSPGIGAYFTIIAGLLLAICGLLSFLKQRSSEIPASSTEGE
jgi:amino acid transporter